MTTKRFKKDDVIRMLLESDDERTEDSEMEVSDDDNSFIADNDSESESDDDMDTGNLPAATNTASITLLT